MFASFYFHLLCTIRLLRNSLPEISLPVILYFPNIHFRWYSILQYWTFDCSPIEIGVFIQNEVWQIDFSQQEQHRNNETLTNIFRHIGEKWRNSSSEVQELEAHFCRQQNFSTFALRFDSYPLRFRHDQGNLEWRSWFAILYFELKRVGSEIYANYFAHTFKWPIL